MASRIQLLDETVANQIAAGEVIERPASVVKELVENALDAESTRIDVEIDRGGKSLIRVTDNGYGMSYEDALLCLERHATSKIRHPSDLLSIASYGFRGEAIPSIASVGRFRLISREKEAQSGTEIVINGGKLVEVKEAGCAVGTSIEVRSLFSNVPARRKFLRADQTEWAHIEQLMRVMSLTRYGVYFTLKHNGVMVSQYPSATRLEDRIASVFGRKWVEETLPVDAERLGMKLYGVIGRPGISRGNRQEQNIFVNGRPVTNPTLNYALLEGYHNALMKGRYPVACLFLEIDPAIVDVNVHPAKREIRFRDDSTIRSFVVDAVSRSLLVRQETPLEVTLPQPFPPTNVEVADVPSHQQPPLSPPAVQPTGEPRPWFGVAPRRTMPEWKGVESVQKEEGSASTTPFQKNHDLKVLGIILNLYIVAENKKGLVLIDQHAAHERILFEQILDRVSREDALSQALLIPAVVELPPEQADFLRNQLEPLHKIGMSVSELGGNSFIIDSLPPMIKTQNVEDFFRNMLVDLQEAGGEVRRQRKLSEEIIAKTACRHAVKANDILKPSEVEKLLVDLHNCQLPYTCPHGRPTMIMISQDELEKKFGRLV